MRAMKFFHSIFRKQPSHILAMSEQNFPSDMQIFHKHRIRRGISLICFFQWRDALKGIEFLWKDIFDNLYSRRVESIGCRARKSTCRGFCLHTPRKGHSSPVYKSFNRSFQYFSVAKRWLTLTCVLYCKDFAFYFWSLSPLLPFWMYIPSNGVENPLRYWTIAHKFMADKGSDTEFWNWLSFQWWTERNTSKDKHFWKSWSYRYTSYSKVSSMVLCTFPYLRWAHSRWSIRIPPWSFDWQYASSAEGTRSFYIM